MTFALILAWTLSLSSPSDYKLIPFDARTIDKVLFKGIGNETNSIGHATLRCEDVAFLTEAFAERVNAIEQYPHQCDTNRPFGRVMYRLSDMMDCAVDCFNRNAESGSTAIFVTNLSSSTGLTVVPNNEWWRVVDVTNVWSKILSPYAELSPFFWFDRPKSDGLTNAYNAVRLLDKIVVRSSLYGKSKVSDKSYEKRVNSHYPIGANSDGSLQYFPDYESDPDPNEYTNDCSFTAHEDCRYEKIHYNYEYETEQHEIKHASGRGYKEEYSSYSLVHDDTLFYGLTRKYFGDGGRAEPKFALVVYKYQYDEINDYGSKSDTKYVAMQIGVEKYDSYTNGNFVAYRLLVPPTPNLIVPISEAAGMMSPTIGRASEICPEPPPIPSYGEATYSYGTTSCYLSIEYAVIGFELDCRTEVSM